jgi:pYEATS domain-containing protein involved in immunity/TIR domain-containing protein
MSYRIAQDFEYVGNDYWRWSAWIEGSDAELDKVKEVVWILHPSFSQSRVVSKQRADKFRLSTAGWGTFLLKAEVVLADGQKLQLKHNLDLEYPAEKSEAPRRSMASPPTRRQPVVYLSYSAEDSRVAAKLRTALESEGIEIQDQTRLKPGQPWNDTLRNMLAKSDGVVGLVGEGEVTSWVSAEIQAAAASAKPTLVLIAGDTPGTGLPGLPKGVQTRQIDLNHLDLKAIAAELGSLKKH